MGILEVSNVTLTLGDANILNNLTIDFWEGHIHAIVGPNGAGKSTFASTLMGLSGYRHYEGDILLEGESLKDLAIDQRAARGISLGWQEPARFEGITVREFIQAGAADKSDGAAREALGQVGLDPDQYLARAVDKTLSGGERKRVELASLLTMVPKIVILDEPDSGIDVEALNRIFEAIRILKEKGSTIILITHSPTVLENAEHAFLMCHGEIIDKGSTDKIMDYFQDKCLACSHKNMPDEEEND